MYRPLSNIILFIFLFALQAGHAQPSFNSFEKLSSLDGLSNNLCNDIIEDSRGFLWITTYNGLNRYDGSEITNFFVDSALFRDNKMSQLVELNDNRLAIGTNGGLLIFNTLTYKKELINFHDLKIEKIEDGVRPFLNQISFVKKDQSGNIWLATPVSIYRLDSGLNIKKIFWSGYTQNDMVTQRIKYVHDIMVLRDGIVLIKIDKGVFVWEKGTNSKPERLIPIDNWEGGRLKILNKVPYNFSSGTRKGNLVFIGDDTTNLYLINPKTGKKTSYSASVLNERAGFNSVLSVLNDTTVILSYETFGFGSIHIDESDDAHFSISYYDRKYFAGHRFGRTIMDREKNIWSLVPLAGLIKIPYKKQLFNEIFLPHINMESQTIYQITCFLKQGINFYIGCNGSGLYKWNQETGIIVHEMMPADELGFGRNIWNIRAGKKDTLWLGTGWGLYWYDPKSKKHGRLKQPHSALLDRVAITTQFTDSYGLVWMGLGIGNGLTVLDPVTNKYTHYKNRPGEYPYRYPYAIAEDSDSNLWFVSDNTLNLVKWDRRTNRFNIVNVNANGREGWDDIYIDKEDRIWIGVLGLGLAYYDIKKPEQGLRYIHRQAFTDCWGRIAEDKNGRLWLTSYNGPVYYDRGSGQIIKYRIAESLFDLTVRAPFLVDSVSGKFYVGYFKKIISFTPEEIKKTDVPLPLYITALNIAGKSVIVPKNRKLKVGVNQNDLIVSFTGINLSDGNDNRYAYKISGENWIDLGKQKQIRFVKLKPGRYNLEIRGARLGEEWSPVTEHLQITVTPPFTQTVWFYLIIISTILLLIYGWHRHQLNQFMQLQRVRSEISGDLHDELGSRLSSLSYMSLIAQKKFPENKELSAMLEKINQNSMKVSASLREIIWGINPELDKLSRLVPYLRQYAAETLELRGIEFLNIPGDIPAYFRLKKDARRDLELIFKEMIHNILKHSQAKKAMMQVSHDKKTVTIKVQDDGIGFDLSDNAAGNGLYNMKQRAMRHRWLFNISSAKSAGTTIVLKLKIT